MRRVVVTLMTIALGLSAANAFAAGTQITYPDATYVADTTKIDLSYLPDGSVSIPSFTDGVVTASVAPAATGSADAFASPMTWGETPEVESVTPVPARLSTSSLAGPQTTTIVLNRPVSIFGFEVASIWANPSVSYSITATFKNQGQIVGSVTKVVPGQTQDSQGYYQIHGRFFGMRSDQSFDEVQVVANGLPPYQNKAGLFIAQFRYALPPVAPVVSAPASSNWSIISGCLLGLLAIGISRHHSFA